MADKSVFKQRVEQAQEKILQAKSAQEIKDLLKQENNFYKEALVGLVSQHIMQQFLPEDIARIEKIPSLTLNTNIGEPPYDYHSDRSIELFKLAQKMDSVITRLIVTKASQLHDPLMIPQFERHFNFPETRIDKSIQYALHELIENDPSTIDKIFDTFLPKIQQDKNIDRRFETVHETGYVQGVCECVAAIGDDYTLGKKLLSEMKVTKDTAKKYANPETFKALEQGIFAQKQDQKIEQTHSIKR